MNYLLSLIPQAPLNLNREENIENLKKYFSALRERFSNGKKTVHTWHTYNLLKHFIGSRNLNLRNGIVDRLSGIVDVVLRTNRFHMPDALEIDDLRQAGLIGLIEAVDRYDDIGKFSTYAFPRIKGAIIDEIRAMGLFPRGVSKYHKRIQEAIAFLQQRDGAEPSDFTIAEHLNEDVRKILEYRSIKHPISLDQDFNNTHEEAENPLVSTLEQTYFVDALEGLIKKDEEKNAALLIHTVMQSLTLDEQLVLSLYHLARPETLSEIFATIPGKDDIKNQIWEKFNQKGFVKQGLIAKLIGLSESRVSQIKSQAFQRANRILRRVEYRPTL